MKNISLLLLLVFSACALHGQSSAVSQIGGVIEDATGAAVPGAQVTITNTDTSAVRSVVSGLDGAYSVTNLQVGPYKLEVTKEGFATYSQLGIVLQVDSNPRVDAVLKVGAVSDRMVVEANAAMVETQSSGVGQVIDEQRILDLPLNGRNVTQLIALSGAAVPSRGAPDNLGYLTEPSVSIAGGQANATNYFLDGGTHMDVRINLGLPLPFPDALQEFKVETSALPANYGNHPGGAVNAVTKSGTNVIHGDAFWFLRNYAFNARNVFAATRDSLKRNQFGGVLGGPVRKNKIFFFVGAQGSTEKTAPATTQSFVPTAAVLQGNFQAILAPPCQAKQVNLLASSGATNNVVPVSLLNPVALKYVALLPLSSDPCGKILYGVPSVDKEYQVVSRADWQRTSSDSLFARYFITDYTLNAFYDRSNLLTAGNTGLLDRVQSVILGDTRVLNPRTVSSLRGSFSRSAVQRIDAAGIPTMTQLGANVYSAIPNYTGQVSASGYFSSGAIPGWVYLNVISLSEDIGTTLGSHQINMGFVWSHTQMNADGPFQQNPRMTFNGQLTGNALADFMTGHLDTMLEGNGQIGREGQNIPSAYFQDHWKLSRQLQINAGLRWDPFIPQHSKYGYASQFDPAGFYAGKVSKVFVNAPPGLTFPGDSGYPGQSDTSPRYLDFAPRFGLVYDPRGKGQETIRAAYGIFYDSSYLWNTLHVPLNPPWGETITLNSPPGGLSNPWQGYPGGDPFPTPARIPSDFPFPTGGTYVFEPPHAHATYLQQWNVALQKQIGSDWLISATYLGNKTTHQWLGYQADPAMYIPGTCTAGQYGLTAPGPCSSTGNTDSRRMFVLSNPATGKYLANVAIVDDNGNASYNGLLLVVQHRLSHGFSVLANYTFSHCLDQGEASQDIGNFYQNPANRRGEWGNCVSDRRGNFNMSMVAQSPRFHSKWLQRIAGNWQASGILTFTTGAWMTITSGVDNALTGAGRDRPNVVGDWRVANNTLGQFFNTAAFVKNAAGTYGNAGKGIIPGRANWDLDTGVWRTFPVGEKLRLDLRWEAFNVVNHARFNDPGTTLSNGNTFGVTTTALDPRIMQVALKATF
jgi:hypothetical protein